VRDFSPRELSRRAPRESQACRRDNREVYVTSEVRPSPQGPRLARLHPAWKVLNDYGPLAYHPLPEPVRLWELTEPIPPTQPQPADGVESSRGP